MKNTTVKLFALTLTASLALTALTACSGAGGSAALPSATPDAAPSQESARVGTVLLSVNPEIEMDYDAAGNVVALRGLNDDGRAVLASYSGYEGRPCTAVVGELVSEIDDDGYFDDTIDGHEKNIVLKLERGSKYPDDAFFEELAEAVRTKVETDQIGSRTVALDDDDLDDMYGDKGYINAAAAQDILSAQMGRDDIQFVEKDYDLDDGDYEVEFIMDGVEYEYEVDAVTGKVTEMEVEQESTPAVPAGAATSVPPAVYTGDDDRYDDDWDDRYDDDLDDDWYGDPTGSDDWNDDDDGDDRYDDDWDDRYDDDLDDDWYGDPTGSDDWNDDDDGDDRYDDDWDDRYDDDLDDDWYGDPTGSDDWNDDDDGDDRYDDDWDDDDDGDDRYDDDWDDDDDGDDGWDD